MKRKVQLFTKRIYSQVTDTQLTRDNCYAAVAQNSSAKGELEVFDYIVLHVVEPQLE
jgi:hypothetical protein